MITPPGDVSLVPAQPWQSVSPLHLPFTSSLSFQQILRADGVRERAARSGHHF